ncbi:NEL-type E3 ubiquitin ligase domain-containing protein [Noviherbaspirillum aerium]|uniref:NEL-type E3 ubiquitin ligase domain-containing protein n=1 Tax=Noviherbaspirillum aerium TaxID=2588497 RepID=UPI00178C46D7|nr:NEL-type E3 ubiquitin ligase domain-containing protein [Noviherbaspirillum aerium]
MNVQEHVQAELLQWAYRANDDDTIRARLVCYQRAVNLQNQRAGDQAEPVPHAIASNVFTASGTDKALQDALTLWVQSAGEADVGPKIEIHDEVMGLLGQPTVESAGQVSHAATGNLPAVPDAAGAPASRRSARRQATMPTRAAKASGDSFETTESDRATSSSAGKDRGVSDSSRASLASSGTSTAERLKALYKMAGKAFNPTLLRPLPVPPLPAQAVWDNWIGLPGQHRGQRKEAVDRIKAWSRDPQNAANHEPLILSGLDLDEIPPRLPKNLANLQFKNNRLNELPALSSLPEGLLTLNLEGNPVRKLSPDSLDEARNRLIITIDNTFLPDDVKEQHCTDKGPIYSFQNHNHALLKAELKQWVDSSPGNEREKRKIAVGRIESYVTNPPWLGRTQLSPLDLSGLSLTTIPPLPAWIRELHFQDNSLRAIPSLDQLPPDIQLRAFDNPIAELPPEFLTTPSDIRIWLDPESLVEKTREALEEVFNKNTYKGPKVSYPSGVPKDQAATKLSAAVKFWADETSASLTDWANFRKEDNASRFADFLTRLREVDPHRDRDPNGDFGRRVVQLLTRLQADPDLRQVCFGLAENALGNCENRIALRFMDMETLCLDKQFEDAIKKEQYNDKPQEVIDYCKSQYRRKLIAEAVYRKIEGVREQQLHVETYLIFFNQFAEKYHLPVQSSTKPGNLVNVTPQEFEELERKLGNDGLPAANADANDQAFLRFLTTSSMMNLLLEKVEPEQMDGLKQRIEEEKAKRAAELYAEEEALSEDPQARGNSHLFEEAMRQLGVRYQRLDDDIQEEMKTDVLVSLAHRRGLTLGL